MYHLRVYLPADRRLPGFMRLISSEGTQLLYDIPCRGKADNARATKEGNPQRSPTLPYGDTPSGLYRPAPITVFSPVHERLGAVAILIEGMTGDAVQAKKNGRTGLAVHGGRGDEQLMATHGCIRTFDRDIRMISNIVLSDQIQVDVVDCLTWPPANIATSPSAPVSKLLG